MSAEMLGGRRRGERGTAAMEMVLSLPILVLVILLLIGLGHTLMAKPRSLVAARYASQYGIVHGSAPSAAGVAQSVGERGQRWSLLAYKGRADDEEVGELERESQQVNESGVSGFFNSLLNFMSGDGRYTTVASTRPRRGIVPRLMTVGEARGAFVIEQDTWNCEKNRGSYLTLITSRASSSLGSVPLLGSVVNAIDGKIKSLPCCETYKSR
jgi:hypothetical protein